MSAALGTVPEGWSLVPLTSVSAQYKGAMTDGPFGSNLKSAHYTESGPRVIRLQNIGDGVFLEADAHISPEHYSTLIKHAVESGDVLIAILGEVLPRACLAPPSIAPAIVKADCIRFRPDPSRALAKYVCLALNAEPTRRRAAAIVHGVGRPRLNLGELRELQIPLAPIDVQQRIVEAVDTHFSRIDAGVDALKRVQANLKRYRASVLKTACEGRLVPTEAEIARRESRDYEPASVLLQRILKERRRHWEAYELAKLKAKGKPPTDDRWKARYRTPEEPNTAGLPDLPTGWCWSAVEQLCETVTDGDHQPPPQVESGIPFLVIGNIRDGAVNLEDCRFVSEEYFRALDPARSPRRGDVLYSVTGSFGLTVLVEDDAQFCVQRHIAILRPSQGVAAQYLVRALSSNAVFRAASAIATGTAQKTVPLTGLRRLAVPLPPGTEQQRIADEIDRRFTLLGALERSVSANERRATRLRQSLLSAAFEGKLVRPTSLPFASVASRELDVAKRAKRPPAELSDV